MFMWLTTIVPVSRRIVEAFHTTDECSGSTTLVSITVAWPVVVLPHSACRLRWQHLSLLQYDLAEQDELRERLCGGEERHHQCLVLLTDCHHDGKLHCVVFGGFVIAFDLIGLEHDLDTLAAQVDDLRDGVFGIVQDDFSHMSFSIKVKRCGYPQWMCGCRENYTVFSWRYFTWYSILMIYC